MVKCPMCGKRFDPDDVEEYIDDKFGWGVLDQIWKENGQICDSCCLSIYYADHPDDESCDESISVYDAAEIWLSSGKDEDQMFGFSEDELEDALK